MLSFSFPLFSLQPVLSSKMVLLFEMARKWQRLARRSRKVEIEDESSLGRYSEGHFPVYAVDGKRYVVPLTYLNHPVFKELLDMAEEEFGLDGHGPLRLPCEGELMDYIVSLLNRNPSQQVEQALVSLTCSSSAFVVKIPN